MKLSLQDFIAQYNGKTGIGDTDQNKGQCVGLVEVWIDNLGLPHIWGNAIDLLANADKTAYTVVKNTPTNSPTPGDIVVLDMGTYGHTAIVVKADVNTLTLFEQNDHDANDPTGACQIKNYTYELLQHTGWIHPNTLPGTETIPITPTVEQVQNQLQQEITAVNQCQTQLKTANAMIVTLQQQITNLTGQVASLQLDKNNLQSKYEAEQQEVSNLNEALAKITTTNKNYQDQAITAQQKADEIGSYFDAVAKRAAVPFEKIDDATIADNLIKVLDEKDTEIRSLNMQVNRYASVRNAITQTVKTIPATTANNFLQKLKSFFFTQK
jgi:surface antigen